MRFFKDTPNLTETVQKLVKKSNLLSWIDNYLRLPITRILNNKWSVEDHGGKSGKKPIRGNKNIEKNIHAQMVFHIFTEITKAEQ